MGKLWHLQLDKQTLRLGKLLNWCCSSNQVFSLGLGTKQCVFFKFYSSHYSVELLKCLIFFIHSSNEVKFGHLFWSSWLACFKIRLLFGQLFAKIWLFLLSLSINTADQSKDQSVTNPIQIFDCSIIKRLNYSSILYRTSHVSTFSSLDIYSILISYFWAACQPIIHSLLAFKNFKYQLVKCVLSTLCTLSLLKIDLYLFFKWHSKFEFEFKTILPAQFL